MSAGPSQGQGKSWDVFAALGTAFLASVCCLLPLVLVMLGIGGAWLSMLTALEPFRPLFAALSVAALGFAFYRDHQAQQADCACEAMGKVKLKRGLLWLATVAVGGLIAAPPLIALAAKGGGPHAALSGTETTRIVLNIEGMTCSACAVGLQATLSRLDGVHSVEVTMDPPQAVFEVDPAKLSAEDLIAAVENAGYQATLPTEGASSSGASAASTTLSVDPMPTMSAAELRRAFNAAKDDVRMVSIVSPTCSECVKGHGVVKQLFQRLDHPRLKALIVWLPMKPKDNPSTATAQAGTFTDPRLIAEGWDTEREIGRLFEGTLGLSGTAWDVYLVYQPGITWEGEAPPKPTYWMHQLTAEAGADQQFCLNPAELMRQVGKILESSF